MALMHCPHCGAENFTMEGWEDLDRCSTCGKPLGAPEPRLFERGVSARRSGPGTSLRKAGANRAREDKSRPA